MIAAKGLQAFIEHLRDAQGLDLGPLHLEGEPRRNA